MNKPLFRIELDGVDLTARIRPRLVSLTLCEERSGDADQLDIVVDDSDGLLAIPRRGVSIALMLGREGFGMVDKGTFTVDEIEHGGAPDLLTLRARSASMVSALRIRKERSWHQKTIGDIVTTIAGEHSLVPRVGRFKDVVIDHIDQTNESDVAFLNRLGKRFDAVATVKKDALLFLPIGARVNSKGEPLPAVVLDRRDGDSHRYHVADRDAYSGVRAYWHDANTARRKSVVAGVSGNAKRLRDTYATEADALAAATAEWQRVQRGLATLEYTLALGRPDITPETTVSIPMLKAPIGETDWLVAKCTHNLSNGLTTRLEMETTESRNNSGDADNMDLADSADDE